MTQQQTEASETVPAGRPADRALHTRPADMAPGPAASGRTELVKAGLALLAAPVWASEAMLEPMRLTAPPTIAPIHGISDSFDQLHVDPLGIGLVNRMDAQPGHFRHRFYCVHLPASIVSTFGPM
jgi:hypothetical protein